MLEGSVVGRGEKVCVAGANARAAHSFVNATVILDNGWTS